jgi:hypothetical protein
VPLGIEKQLRIGSREYRWSAWLPLEQALAEPALSAEPGLYRIRRVGSSEIDYIGQTGVGIRTRIRMLRGITGQEMPYRDPHTAGPALWALIHSSGCRFEVAGLPVSEGAQWRKGLEAVAIALYRQQTGRSPSVNFGRMPTGYLMSSGNNARLAASGKRFRGGTTTEALASHLRGVAPVGGLGGDPQSSAWCGHAWSDWTSLNDLDVNPALGLYRIRGTGEGLVYIGEGAIPSRLRIHAAKANAQPDEATPQQRVFLASGPLEYSYVEGEWETHQRLELENDLIAAHLLTTDTVPPAQFIG